MSRYAMQDSQGRDAIVGWDPPLQTFFLQGEFLGEDGREREVPGIWIGGLPAEIPTIDALIARVQSELGVALPKFLENQLLQDRMLSEPQTDAQRQTIAWLDHLFGFGPGGE